ncbi:hypothetical protein AYI69_g10911, partial [Smittium culicis]
NKESNRGSQDTRSRLLQPAIRYSKEDRGTQTCPGFTETEHPRRRTELQNGVSRFNMQTHKAKRLHDVSRSRRRIHAHPHSQILQEVSALLLERKSIPIQSAPVWTVPKPAHFYQGSPPDTIMGESTQHQNIGIPGRYNNYWGIERSMYKEYRPNILEADGAGIQNQTREVVYNSITDNNPSGDGYQFQEHEPQGSFLQDSRPPPRSDEAIESWPDDVEMPGELYWESPGYVSCPTSGSPNAETTPGTKEQCLVIEENVDINGETYRACQTEPFVLERPTSSLERPIVPPGDPRTGTVYRCQRHRLGDSCGLTILLRIVESFGGVDAHQRQRTINDIIRTPAPECCWSFGIGLLRQYHHSSVCKEVWWEDFPETARNCRRNMEPLPSDEHTPPGHIRSVCNESSGCTESTNRADGMVNVRPSVLQNNGIIRTTRCRPVCIENKHQASKILQLVSRQQGCRSELPALQLVRLDQPLLLPPVEPNFPGSPESAQRTSDNHFNHTAMENSNVVSGSTGIISCPAIASTGNDGHTRPQKRKISAVEQQKLVPYGMENQRRILQAQGLSDIAIDIIVSNQRAIKRRS